MNGRMVALAELEAMAGGLSPKGPEVLACPPATLLALARARVGESHLALGAQDCAAEADGAYTGDLSAAMLADAGATAVIVGHSERRIGRGESNALVAEKARAAARAGLRPIVCVGETLAERDAGHAADVVSAQIRESVPAEAPEGLVIAYEPVWAIGTGRTPTLTDIEAIHAAARAALADRIGRASADVTRILYGGSVKPENAAEIFTVAGVDGALVGGASLKAKDFLAIVTAWPQG
jgi:triosephosphate isomerase